MGERGSGLGGGEEGSGLGGREEGSGLGGEKGSGLGGGEDQCSTVVPSRFFNDTFQELAPRSNAFGPGGGEGVHENRGKGAEGIECERVWHGCC